MPETSRLRDVLTYGIGYGANLGARAANFGLARALLALEVNVEASSALYLSAPLGAADKPFLNGALRVATNKGPDALLAILLRVETLLGRERREKWGNRTCDLDILWASGDRYESPQVQVPHPELLNRNFALAPLLEVVPELATHTHNGRPYPEHLHTLPGELYVFKEDPSQSSWMDALAREMQSACAWDATTPLDAIAVMDFDLRVPSAATHTLATKKEAARRAGRRLLAATVLEIPEGPTFGRLLVASC